MLFFIFYADFLRFFPVFSSFSSAKKIFGSGVFLFIEKKSPKKTSITIKRKLTK